MIAGLSTPFAAAAWRGLTLPFPYACAGAAGMAVRLLPDGKVLYLALFSPSPPGQPAGRARPVTVHGLCCASRASARRRAPKRRRGQLVQRSRTRLPFSARKWRPQRAPSAPALALPRSTQAASSEAEIQRGLCPACQSFGDMIFLGLGAPNTFRRARRRGVTLRSLARGAR